MVTSETQGRETDSLNVYLLPDSFTCRHEIKAVRYNVRTVTTRDWNKLFTRLIEHHNEAFGRGGLVHWCTKSQSSLLNINFRLRGCQSSLLLIHLRYDPNTCSHCCTKMCLRTYPIYMTLHFCDRWGAGSLRSRKGAQFTLPLCEQKPYLSPDMVFVSA